jgi:hypothetical protein
MTSLELATLAMSGFSGDGVRVNEARVTTSLPVVALPATASARGGGGGSSELPQRRCSMEMALEALTILTNYVYVITGERCAW